MLIVSHKDSVVALLPILIAVDIMAAIYQRQHAWWRKLGELLPGVAAGMLARGLFFILN